MSSYRSGKKNTIKVQLVELFGVKLLKSYFDCIQFELLHFAQVTQMKWEEYLTRFCGKVLSHETRNNKYFLKHREGKLIKINFVKIDFAFEYC